MSSSTLWPYVLMTVGWIVIFGYLLNRVLKGGTALRSPFGEAAVSRCEQPPQQVVDTQAGRI